MISFQSIQAGALTPLSVIPHHAELHGMVKWFDEDVQSVLRERLIATAEAAASMVGATAEVVYSRSTRRRSINDPEEAERLERITKKVVGASNVITNLESSMGATRCIFPTRAGVDGRQVPASLGIRLQRRDNSCGQRALCCTGRRSAVSLKVRSA